MVPGLLITDMAAVAGHTPMSVEVPKMSLAPRIFQFRPSHIPDTQPLGEENQHVNLAKLPTDVFSQVFPSAFLLFPPTKSKLFRVDTPNHIPCLVPQWPVASKSREPVLKILKRPGFTMIPQKSDLLGTHLCTQKNMAAKMVQTLR